jgi:PII-like signaling protein
MKIEVKAKVLRVYLDENIKSGNKLLYRAIIEKWLSLKMSGATVFKGIEGFGASAHMHDAGILEISENLPIVIEMVDAGPKVMKALKAVESLLPDHCLVTLQKVKAIHYQHYKKK